MLQSAASSPNLPVTAIQANNVAPKMVPFWMNEVAFVENKGQYDPQVRYVVKNGNKTIWLTDTGLVFDVLRVKEGPSSSQHSVNNMTPVPTKMANDLSERQFERLVFKEQFDGANARPTIEARGQLPGKFNYFTGSNPKNWQTNVASYSEVIYRDVWPGVDVLFRSAGADIEQQFLVHPGAAPRLVKVMYEGIDKLEVASDGALVIHTQFGKLRETPPSLYQVVGGQRHTVQGKFNLLSSVSYAFNIEKYRPDAELVIDPTLQYSTYLGGNGNDGGSSITVDALGATYVSGGTGSSNFPTTAGALMNLQSNSFITKLSPISGQIVYSTYFPASIASIAINERGEVYITGTAGNNLPITQSAYQPSCSGQTVFLTKLDTTGSILEYSTCFGLGAADTHDTLYGPFYGSDGHSVTVDSKGVVYIGGNATGGIPTTTNAYQPSQPQDPRHCEYIGGYGWGCTGGATLDAFLMVLKPNESGAYSLFYSTYLGGKVRVGSFGGADYANAVTADSSGNAYIAGRTDTTDFPVTANAFQKYSRAGVCAWGNGYAVPCGTGFVAKINPNLSGPASLVYSTFLGGTNDDHHGNLGDKVNGIAVDSSGAAYVTGTASSPDFPITGGAYSQNVHYSATGGFITKINPEGSALVYSTFLPGTLSGAGSLTYAWEGANDIAVDSEGNAFVVGCLVGTAGFQFSPDAWQNIYGGGDGDAYLLVLDPAGSNLIYSTLLGGKYRDSATKVALDNNSDVYIMGYTQSGDFPTTSGAAQTVWGGGTDYWGMRNADVFVAKFAWGSAVGPLEVFPNHGGNGGTVTVNIYGSGLSSTDTVKLTTPGQPDIIGTDVTTTAHVKTSVTFDLKGINAGQYSMVVTRSDNTSRTVSQPFTVNSGGEADVWVDILGWDPMRGGSAQTYYIAYGNSGNLDSKQYINIWVTFPNFVKFNANLSQKPDAIDTIDTNNTILAFHVPMIPAGGSGVIPINLTGPTDSQYAHSVINLEVWYDAPDDLPLDDAQESSIDAGQTLSSQMGCSECSSTQTSGQLSSGTLDNQTSSGNCPVSPSCPSRELSDCQFKGDSIEKSNRQDLLLHHIKVNKCPCSNPENECPCQQRDPVVRSVCESAHQDTCNCTNVNGWTDRRESTLRAVEQIGDEFGTAACPLILTGGSEKDGHVDGEYSHPGGYKVDFCPNNCVSPKICAECTQICNRCYTKKDGTIVQHSQWQCPDGLVFTNEGDNHWDISFSGNGPSCCPSPCSLNSEQVICTPIGIVTPGDPNDKVGPRGVGPQKYILGATPLNYAIEYSNEQTASAAAQKVIVNDQLDLSKVNLSTFSLGPIFVAGQILTPPANSSEFYTTLDLRPGNNLLLSIAAHLEKATGLLTWTFQSWDPATYMPPEDPSAGFLPPGAVGSVFFTVMLKDGLATNAQIQNKATIVFDNNAPMDTPTWLNTIDNSAPVSYVLTLPAKENASSFIVQWTGSDASAGVKDYSIFVSQDGGAYTPFQANTTVTSATFQGQPGSRYAFYSVARDLTGNVEKKSPTAEASTTLASQLTLKSTGAYFLDGTYRDALAADIFYNLKTKQYTGSLKLNAVKATGRIAMQTTSVEVKAGASAGNATIDGFCTVNGVSGYTYEATLNDVANPGAGKDKISIKIMGPNSYLVEYTNKTIAGGDISVSWQ